MIVPTIGLSAAVNRRGEVPIHWGDPVDDDRLQRLRIVGPRPRDALGDLKRPFSQTC